MNECRTQNDRSLRTFLLFFVLSYTVVCSFLSYYYVYLVCTPRLFLRALLMPPILSPSTYYLYSSLAALNQSLKTRPLGIVSPISSILSTLSTYVSRYTVRTVVHSSAVFTSRRYNAFVGSTPLSLLLLQLSLDEDTLLTRKSYLIGFQLCRFFLLFAVLQGDFTREEIRICQKSRWEQ